jgi:hypothetical protein
VPSSEPARGRPSQASQQPRACQTQSIQQRHSSPVRNSRRPKKTST